MNRHAHKIIFNKRLGRMDVVSEIVSSQGKGSQTAGYSNNITTALIKPLVFALMLTLGTAQILPVHAGTIVADPSAPKTEQPTILNTASGATQVNIQTPTAAGVSMNQYQQFDAQSNGTILNNSRTNANTQTAGWIQGNPWLATGTARVIVNQVNSSNPSLLNGNIEVAGNRAEVIIANPAGIQVNGATFINAARTTLSTGKPIIDNGNLTGYQVNQGQISVNGQGLNAQASDYTDILARSTQINAGIWSKQIKVTTGANTVNVDNTQATAITASGAAPQFAIDTSVLGGMYAGKITLIGTEQGVGINNAGQIAATAGNILLDSKGQLTNSGTINANLDSNGSATTQIKSQSLHNSGTISSQGNTQIQTGQATNSGTLAAGRELKLNASDINNSKGTINGQRVELNANSLNNTQGKIQQTGTQALALNSGSLSNANNGLIGYEPISSGTGTGTGTGIGSTGSTGGSTNTGTPSTATGGGSSTVVQPAPVALADGAINITGAVNNDAGQITANGGIDLTAQNGLDNHATLNLNKLTVSGNRLDNSSGTLTVSHAQIQTDSINNTAGQFGSTGDIQLTTGSLTNTQGKFTASGGITAAVQGATLNDQGVLASNGALQLNTGSLNNSQGTLSSVQSDATINSQGMVNNASGQIVAAKGLQLSSTQLDNGAGKIKAQTLSLDTRNNSLNNAKGQISADQTTISSGALNNEAGLLQAAQSLTVNTNGQTLTNTNSGSTAGILSGGTLNLNTTLLDNTAGRINSNQTSVIRGTELNNAQGNIATGQDLELTLNGLSNNKGLITAGNNLSATVSQTLNNDQGTIAGNQTVALNTQLLSNTQGQIASVKGNASIQSASQINNQQGQIIAAQNLSTHSEQLNNQNGQLLGQNVALNSTDLNNDAGLIQATQALSIDTHGANLTNTHSGAQGGILSGGSLAIASGNLNNQAGVIAGAGSAQLSTKAVNNQQGQISLQSQLDWKSSDINNSEGLIRVGQVAHLTANAINNSNTQAVDKGLEASELHLNTTDLDNASGAVRGNTLLEINATGHLNNTSGSITAEKALKVQGSSLAITNTNGLFNAGQSEQITVQSLTGDGQILSQQDLSIDLSSDWNNTGKVQAGRDLELTTTGTLSNDSSILAGRINRIHAQNINNTASAQIAGTQTELNSRDSLTNRGLIDGNSTYLKANSLNNIGTGRIYGDDLSIAATTLNNIDETIAGKNTAATIAARRRLDIGAQTINNREHATLYADGSLNIGGALDANRLAIGQADTINNASATIESTGDMSLAAQHINNTNEHFSVRWISDPVATEHREEYALAGQAQRYTGGTWDRRSGDKNQQWAYYTTADGQVIPGERWDIWNYDRKTYRQEVASSDPAKIIAGGNLTFLGGTLTNDKSQILSGRVLSDLGLQAVKQINADAQQRIETEGTYTFSGWSRRWYSGKRRPRRFENTSAYTSLGSDPNVATIYSTITLPVTEYKQHQAVQGSGLTVGAVNTGSSVPTADSMGNATAPNLTAHNTGETSSITSVQSLNTTDPTLIKSGAVNTQMPNSSLYTINPNSSDAFIQTDPRFTNYRNWLSSDWMLGALRLDPANMHKRLGDGYYEQKLVRDQVAQLTGRRFLAGHKNDDDQYKALMNAGVTFAGQYNLRPGIALTQEQMAHLTSDIVWLVEQNVVLPDGRTVTALVPKVYVAVKPGDIDGTGTLISADQIKLNLTGDLNNAGTIAGRSVTQISAENVNNLGGRISADQLSLQARNNLNNIGGTIDAHTRAQLLAGNDINFTTTTQFINEGLAAATTIDRVAGLYIGKGAESGSTSLVVKAGNDLNLNAAQISNTGVGTTALLAGNDIHVGTVTQTHREQVSTDANNYRRESSSTDIGSSVQTQSHLIMQAGHNLSTQAASLNSQDGKVALQAQNDIQITEGRSTYELDEAHKIVSRGVLSKSTLQTHDTINSNTAISSDITGKQVVVNAGHDALIRGSNVVSDNLTQVNAGNDVNILSASNSETTSNFKEIKKSGLMGTGGFGFMIGSKQQSTDTDNTNVTQNGSQVGSLGGKVNIVAGNHYQQTGSSVTSGQSVDGQFVAGDAVNIIAKSVDITAGQNTYATDTVHQTKQSGLTVAVNVPVVNAVMAVADTAKTVGQSKNDRVNAMAAANTAYAGYQAYQAVSQVAQNGFNASVSITVGSSKTRQETHTKGTEAVSSTVAGKEVNIIATGGGTDSNIHVQGSNISGTEATRLIADNNVILESAQNTSEEHSSNKSSGWNAGVVVGTQGIGITAGGNYGKGKGEGASVTQVNSHVGSQTGQTQVLAGGDTKLAGAQLLGNRVELDTNNLVIESRQDTNKYDSKQKDISGQVTVGYGFSVSGNYSQNKVNADYASVNEQSGILAGDGGYNVNVKKHTDLKGGIITSTQAAEDAGKNSFTTGTLTASDIQNHADYSASGFGIGGGFGVNGKGEQGKWAAQGANTNGVVADNQQGKAGLTVNKSIGYGSDSGHNSSVTTSGINTSNIAITDAAGQNATGISVDQIKAQVKTDTTTDTVQANSGAIANNFDKDAVQKEIGLQVAVTQQFDTTRQGVKAEINKHIDGLQAELKAAKTLEEKAAIEQKINSWQNAGTLTDMIAGGLSAPTSSALGIAAATAAPAVQYKIGQIFKDNQAKNELDKLMMGTAGTRPEEGSTLHVLAHTVLAAAVAAAGGNDALTAGLSAGGAEALAPVVSNWLYGKDAKELTADEKSTVSNIVSLGAAGFSAGAGGTGADVAQAAQLASSALENNYLMYHERVKLETLREQKVKLQQQRSNTRDALDRAVLDTQIAQLDGEIKHLEWVDWKTNQDLISACSGPTANAEGCKQESSKFYNTNLSWSSGHSLYDSAVLGLSDQGKRNVYAGYDENERLSHYAKLSPAAASQFSMEQVAGNAVGMSGYMTNSGKTTYKPTSAGSKGSFQARDPMTGRNAILENTTSRNMRVIEVSNGTQSMANADFDRMNLSNVRPIESAYGTWGRMGTTEDGLRVIVRPSQDGRPTIQVQRAQANGKLRTVTEVRYGTK